MANYTALRLKALLIILYLVTGNILLLVLVDGLTFHNVFMGIILSFTLSILSAAIKNRHTIFAVNTERTNAMELVPKDKKTRDNRATMEARLQHDGYAITDVFGFYLFKLHYIAFAENFIKKG